MVTFLLSLEITGGQNIEVTNPLMFPICFVQGLLIVAVLKYSDFRGYQQMSQINES